MDETNKEVLKLIRRFNPTQKRLAEDLIKNESNWGLRNYGIIKIGLGEHFIELTQEHVQGFYDFPAWTPNQVDKLIAEVKVSIKKFYPDVIFNCRTIDKYKGNMNELEYLSMLMNNILK